MQAMRRQLPGLTPCRESDGGAGARFPSATRGNADGIEVEGLDASSWTLSTEVGVALKAEATAEPDTSRRIAGLRAVETSPEAREYKVLTPKDKYFDGKFDLTRLEEALNHFGRQGWTVKSMSTPHVKGFSGRSRRRSWFCSSAEVEDGDRDSFELFFGPGMIDPSEHGRLLSTVRPDYGGTMVRRP